MDPQALSSGLSWGGWALMVLSWTTLTALVVFCMRAVLRRGSSKDA